jgi:hypothetical protein
MHHHLRLSLVAGLLSLLASVATFVRPVSLSDLDFWRVPEYEHTLRRESEHGHDLDERLQKTHARLAAKDEIFQRLYERRLTLTKAAALIRDLPDPPPNAMELIRRYEEGQSEEECLCRHVIRGVQTLLLERQSEAAARAEVSRLEEELRDHMTQHGGKVCLP